MKLERLWRQAATGFCFTMFGLGGLLILLLTPLMRLLVRGELQQERFMKRTIHNCFRLFTWLMETTRVLTIEVSDIHKLRQPGQLIIANHPTLIDVVYLISFIPQADCVVKSALLRNPFTRGAVLASHYIANDDPEAIVDAVEKSLARGNSVIIFPEGTRSVPGQPYRLQRGAANIAIRTANKLRPVIIKCDPPTLTKGSKWYSVPSRRFLLSFRVDEPIEIEPFQNTLPTVASRQLTQTIADYFTGETHSQ